MTNFNIALFGEIKYFKTWKKLFCFQLWYTNSVFFSKLFHHYFVYHSTYVKSDKPVFGKVIEKCEDVSHDDEDRTRPKLDQISDLDHKLVFRFQFWKKCFILQMTYSHTALNKAKLWQVKNLEKLKSWKSLLNKLYSISHSALWLWRVREEWREKIL